ncbi:superinfection immunity protein [Paraburkholderia oxyphila]|uniref:superinfection immunity protein n=1 Tax=Paraburkholderia oxyphila TaxID=614212 RepID=UPI000488A116|nr:superinfection immunity protein [Paraburkholderia oxyphila]
MRSVIAYVLLAFVAVAYFTPSMIAQRRMKEQAARIFLFNLLLGWTVTGWLGVLSWATSSQEADLRSAQNAIRWHRPIGDARRARGPRC